MKWIELIVVRAADARHRPTVRRLLGQLTPDGRPDELTSVTLYRNAFVETDIGIHLQWEREGSRPMRSDIGLELAAALEEFGRVHHTIWIDDEMPADEE